MLRDPEDVLRRLGTEAGLSREESVLYLSLLEKGSIPSSTKGPSVERLLSAGMAILSGDGKRYIPVHPRLAVANQFRTWREGLVKEINDRRLATDRLILQLIPLYEAATEKRLGEKGRKEGP